MTDTVINRIRKALFHDIHDAEGALASALDDLAISGGGSGEHILRRIRYALFHASEHSESDLRAALADLEIAGSGAGTRILHRIRKAIFESDNNENNLRVALSDLINGGGYRAGAVHFEWLTGAYVKMTVSGLPDTGKFLMSQWLANTGSGTAQDGDDNISFVSLPNLQVEVAALLTLSDPTPASSPIFGQFANIDFSIYQSRVSVPDVYPITPWTNIIISVNMEPTLDVNKRFQVVKNGVLLSTAINAASPSNASIICEMSAEDTIIFGSDNAPGASSMFDTADFQLWVGVSPDLSDSDNIAKFIAAGKPVDPAIAAAAFGTQQVLLSGNAAEFIVNQGNAGAVSQVAGTITTASTSPSD